ncbi:MAG: rhomboid family intramembrane serine protease [Pseudomonadota bacterium]
MFANLLPATRAILLACIAGYLAQLFIGVSVELQFALWPLRAVPGYPPFQPWQLVSYAFLHGGTAHIFFNMFALYMFGSEIERLLGLRRYVIYYFACVVGAAATQLLVGWLSSGPSAPTVGASGGIFGLLLAFGLAFPQRKLMLIFPPIPMPAWLFVTLYGVLELVLGVTGTNQGVAHFAHLGGMAAGFLLIVFWRARLR